MNTKIQNTLDINLIVATTITQFTEKAKGRGHWGHRGRPGKRGGSAPSKGVAIQQFVPAGNLADLKIGPGAGLHEVIAPDWEGGFHPAEVVMYNPQTRTLLVGNENHVDLHAAYAREQRYDRFVKARIDAKNRRVDIHLDRVQSRGTTDAWNKAFDTGKVLRSCGLPADFTVRLMYYEEDSVAAEVGLGEI